MDPKVCSRIHNSPPLVPILSQTNPVHPLLPEQSLIRYFNITFPSMPRYSKWSLFPENPTRTSSLARMCPMPHLLHFLDFYSFFLYYHLGNIGEECKSRNSSVCNILQSPVTSPHLRPKCLPHLFHSQTLSKWEANLCIFWYHVICLTMFIKQNGCIHLV